MTIAFFLKSFSLKKLHDKLVFFLENGSLYVKPHCIGSFILSAQPRQDHEAIAPSGSQRDLFHALLLEESWTDALRQEKMLRNDFD